MACLLCPQPVLARRLCKTHYGRFWQQGRIKEFESPREVRPVHDRFWNHVTPTDGCWIWQGSLTKDGYGQFFMDGKRIRAHRASFKLFNGELGSSEIVCHRCDTPRCVNPNHLFKGTQADNNRDASIKRRFPLGPKHHATKLTDDAVRAIRSDSLSRHRDLAERYDVTPRMIRAIRAGTRRQHVEFLQSPEN